MNGNNWQKWIATAVIAVFMLGTGYILDDLNSKMGKIAESLSAYQESLIQARERIARNETNIDNLKEMVKDLCEEVRKKRNERL